MNKKNKTKNENVDHTLPFSMIILSIGYPATGHLRKNVFPATADNLGIGLTYGIPIRIYNQNFEE